MKSQLNIWRRLERFSLFRDVLPESIHQIGRCVVLGFSGESIEKGPVFIPDTTRANLQTARYAGLPSKRLKVVTSEAQLLASSMPE